MIPYFGKLPREIDAFLLTVKWNPNFDWLLLTDDKSTHLYPQNAHVVYSTFEKIKERVQERFDFEISLSRPRKLCDYKPAYGLIFEDYLKEYDYWGYCDLDQYFGNLDNWLTDDYLSQYDRLFSLGHMTIYRNKPEINKLFMLTDAREDVELNSYKQVFQCENGLIFDELPKNRVNISNLAKQAKVRQSYDWFAADIVPFRSYFAESFCDAENEMWSESGNLINYIVLWENGRIWLLYKKEREIIKKEVLYVHLQKRKFNIKRFDMSKTCFIIVPNKIISFSEVPSVNRLNYYFWKQRIRKLSKNDEIKRSFTLHRQTVKQIIRKRLNWLLGR